MASFQRRNETTTFSGNNLLINANHVLLNGNNCTVHGNYAVVTGNNCIVYGDDAVVTGNNATVAGDYCKVTGNNADVGGKFGYIVGNNCRVIGDHALIVGVWPSQKGFKCDQNCNHDYGPRNARSLSSASRILSPVPTRASSVTCVHSGDGQQINFFGGVIVSDDDVFRSSASSSTADNKLPVNPPPNHSSQSIANDKSAKKRPRGDDDDAAKLKHGAPQPRAQKQKRRKTRLQDELRVHQDVKAVDNEKACVVCWENEAVVLFQCGHKSTCVKCSSVLIGQDSGCPQCRKRITNVMHMPRVFDVNLKD